MTLGHGFQALLGYRTDTETGLVYCQNRYYDIANGRWLTRDPIGTAGGANLYSYCGAGPVGNADPNGLRKLTYKDRVRFHKLRNAAGTDPELKKLVENAISELKAEIANIAEGDSDPVRLRALWYAIDHLGDEEYGASDGTNRSNIFVYDCYLDGAKVPMPDRKGWFPGTQPFGANEFGDKGTRLAHFAISDRARPGDIIAFGHIYANESGHMTLKVGSGLLIYAGSNAVKLGTHRKNQNSAHKPSIVRQWGGMRPR